ncbi:unnamed protein product [Blepharisma stoltei]|uniref:Phosducin domain-containing protein n=1 Tax=Blepharisma stoltei TaxID=1481888 RepID=A0AAU9ISX9_9CILI|nr:unnamed protein product [Blepharisma stoltei]
MAWNVSTEWDDIHRRLGNKPPKEVEPTLEDLTKQAVEELEKVDPLESKNLQELEELEEDQDEKIFQEYRAKRLKELQEAAMKPKFGRVIEISRQDFIQEVNNAPTDVYVILHLYQEHIVHSRLLDQIFPILAAKFINHKFIKIQATRCVENFRDCDVPALIVYKNGALGQQLLGCGEFLGGNRMTPDSVEWTLAQVGVWTTEIEENPLNNARAVIKKKEKRHNEDESDSDEDRQYSSNQIKKKW